MNQIWIFIIGVIIGAVFAILFSRKKSKIGLIGEESKKYEENKQKILKFLEGKQKIANNEVEQLLGVSDSTATRYLDELEKEGKVRQVGKTGRYTYYSKI